LKLNENIFRAYDIRGIAFEDLSEEVVIHIGIELAKLTIIHGKSSVIVGRDGRNSSPQMCNFLKKGILKTGCNVIDIGIVPTPALYFATHTLETDCGIMITGSHNPSNFNGFKIVMNNVAISGEQIQNLKNSILQFDNSRSENFLKGEEKNIGILQKYSRCIVENINLKRSLKIVIDCGNGAASVIAQKIFTDLGCEVISLFCELDGDFPNHHPDPSREENMQDLISEVKRNKADIGLAFDGDGDRLGVVSPTGEIIYADRQMMLFAKDILEKKNKRKIVYDVKCSKLLPEIIKEYDGIPVISKTGHSFIKEKIREVSAALGGEMSGHIFFNDRWPGFDDGIYAGARLLEIISNSEEDQFKSIPKIFSTPEINIEVEEEDKFKIIEDFKTMASFPDANIIYIDGVRAEFKNGWGLLRASNTSAILVLRFEAETEKELERIIDLFRKEIGKIDKKLMKFG
jgi:phosphomannomutase / phosphoglucomutase